MNPQPSESQSDHLPIERTCTMCGVSPHPNRFESRYPQGHSVDRARLELAVAGCKPGGLPLTDRSVRTTRPRPDLNRRPSARQAAALTTAPLGQENTLTRRLKPGQSGVFSGDDEARTRNRLLARQMHYQLVLHPRDRPVSLRFLPHSTRFGCPLWCGEVTLSRRTRTLAGPEGLEPSTLPLTGACAANCAMSHGGGWSARISQRTGL